MMYKTVVMLVIATITVGQARPEDDKYTTKYDDINVDEILTNKRLLVPYVDCLLEKIPCTAEGTLLKEIIPDALGNDCGKCSEKQRKGATRVLKHLYEKEQELYKKLEAKYDAGQKYKKQYKADAAKEGIIL